MPARRPVLLGLGTLVLGGCLARDDAGTATPAADSPATTAPGSPSSADDTTPSAPENSTSTTPDAIDGDWPMPGGDPGQAHYAAGSPGPKRRIGDLWAADADAALSAPVVAGGTVYVGGDDGRVRALDARTGETDWTTAVGALATTPRVVGDRLYVPTDAGVVALAADDGSVAWRVGTPAVAGLLAATHGLYGVAGGEDPALVARDRADGSERWRAGIDDPWTTPVFSDGEHVFVSSGTHDRVPWAFTRDTGEFVPDREPQTGADFAAEMLARNGTVFAADGFFGNLRAHAVVDGGYETRWRAGVDAYGSFALAADDDRLYFVGGHGEKPGLYAAAQDDGAVVWRTDAVREVVGRPVVADETVLVRTSDALRCFDPADGSERWAYPAGTLGERVVVADDVVFTTRDGTVRALRGA